MDTAAQVDGAPADVRTTAAAHAVEIVPCHPDHLNFAWPVIEPWLEDALKYGPDLYGTEDIFAMVERKDMALWLAIENGKDIIGFCVTSLSKYPKALVCDIHWTGGPKHVGRRWLVPMFETLKNWARVNRLPDRRLVVGGGGRRGWIKTLGFKESGVMFEMELE